MSVGQDECSRAGGPLYELYVGELGAAIFPSFPPTLLTLSATTTTTMGISRPRTFRDVALIFLGAAAMHFTTSFLGPFGEHPGSIIVNTQVSFFSVRRGIDGHNGDTWVCEMQCADEGSRGRWRE